MKSGFINVDQYLTAQESFAASCASLLCQDKERLTKRRNTLLIKPGKLRIFENTNVMRYCMNYKDYETQSILKD